LILWQDGASADAAQILHPPMPVCLMSPAANPRKLVAICEPCCQRLPDGHVAGCPAQVRGSTIAATALHAQFRQSAHADGKIAKVRCQLREALHMLHLSLAWLALLAFAKGSCTLSD